MAVPETAVHENGLSIRIQHNIGFSRQAPYTRAVANPDLFDDAAYCELGSRTSGAHAAHYVAAFSAGECVHEQV